MNVNTREQLLNEGLSLFTYLEKEQVKNIAIPDNKLNIFVGIGLWSKVHKLSIGLPVDVIKMLLTAAVLRAKMMDADPGKRSTVILLIADSMAIHEGAAEEGIKERVAKITEVYKRGLRSLLHQLNLGDSSLIILSSELERSKHYQTALKYVTDSPVVQTLQTEDPEHCAYIRTQTAITRYMHQYGHAGIKVGWIFSKALREQLSSKALWDELKFDELCKIICPDLKMQYLYARAGLKKLKSGKQVKFEESCPYTAFSGYLRSLVLSNAKIEKIGSQVGRHWQGVAEYCLRLKQANIVSSTLIEDDRIHPSNQVATVYNLLNHWANLSAPVGLTPDVEKLQVLEQSEGKEE